MILKLRDVTPKQNLALAELIDEKLGNIGVMLKIYREQFYIPSNITADNCQIASRSAYGDEEGLVMPLVRLLSSRVVHGKSGTNYEVSVLVLEHFVFFADTPVNRVCSDVFRTSSIFLQEIYDAVGLFPSLPVK